MFFCVVFFIVINTIGIAQNKQPAIFRWQDKHAKKCVKKYLKNDTIISTGQAQLHVNYNTDTTKQFLLLLHGLGANARTNWSGQIKDLSKKFNLILPDLVYFGESTSSTQNYSVEFQAQQIHEAISKLGISSKLNVMGFSYGALVASIFNQLYPDKVKKLIIIDGPVKYFSGQMADSMATLVGEKKMANVVAPTTIASFNAMYKAVMSKHFPLSKRLKRKLINFHFIPNKIVRDKQMNYLMEHQETYQHYNYNIDVTPTLLIWGQKDGIVPVSVGHSLHKAYPQTTKLIIYPKAKHDSHFRERKKLNKAVISFLKK